MVFLISSGDSVPEQNIPEIHLRSCVFTFYYYKILLLYLLKNKLA